MHARGAGAPRVAALLAPLLFLNVASPVLAQDATVRRQLTPTGSLRVGINTNNQLTRAVGAEIGRAIARRLGVDARILEYPSPGAVADAVGDEWDIAFVAADPDRGADTIAFTPPYVELEATYLVADRSPAKSVRDLDRPGVKIATGATSAYTLVLKRELKQAELVFMTNEAAERAVGAGTVDAAAGLRFALQQSATRVPGTRVLPDALTWAQQAIAVPKANTAAVTWLTGQIRELTASGFIGAAITRTGLTGARIP